MVLVDEAAPQGNYWGGDQNIPTPRPTYQINSSHPGTDAAASASAAFAAAALLYSGNGTSLANSAWTSTALADATYSALLLTHAEQLYQFAQTAKQRLYQDSVPQATSYPSDTYQDDLILAAIWLYRATSNSTYLSDAVSLYSTAKLQGSNAVFNWASKVPALPILLAQSVTDGSAQTYEQESHRYFDVLVNAGTKANDKNTAYYTDGGLLVRLIESCSSGMTIDCWRTVLLWRFESS
jgi:endoglucanase